MFEKSNFNMNKFVHTFIQNLSLATESRVYRRFSQIMFSRLVDKPYRIKQLLLLHSTEKMKEISLPENLDLSNEKHIEYFVEKYTGLSDKFTYSNNSRILNSHLRNINMKILQKIKTKKKHNEGVKKGDFKTSNRKLRINVSNKLSNLKKNLSSSVICKEKCSNVHNYEKYAVTSSKLVSHDPILNNFKHDTVSERNTEEEVVKHNLVNEIINVAKSEIEMTEKYLSFSIRDKEFIKRNVQVTLHVQKNLKRDQDTREQVEYNQVLCHHAILCLIEPSKKGVVLMEDDLSVVVQKYLSHGYKYHFEFQRDSKDCLKALLILSRWAKVLVRHTNTTLMHTICGILGCDVQNILILYNPEGK